MPTEEKKGKKQRKWVPYQGPRGGKGWRNTETGAVFYGADMPDSGGVEEADTDATHDLARDPENPVNARWHRPDEPGQDARSRAIAETARKRPSFLPEPPAGKSWSDYGESLHQRKRSRKRPSRKDQLKARRAKQQAKKPVRVKVSPEQQRKIDSPHRVVECPVTPKVGLTINGIPLKSWKPPKDWRKVEGQKPDLHEPAFVTSERTITTEKGFKKSFKRKLKRSAGCVVIEDDGRAWVFEPADHFGGVEHTFPKGRLEGLTPQQAAIKEMFEETGLKVDIDDYVGDYDRSTTRTRYYLARRTGGATWDAHWESHQVKLVPHKKLPNRYLNKTVDHQILSDALDRWSQRKAGQGPGKGGLEMSRLAIDAADVPEWLEIGNMVATNLGHRYTPDEVRDLVYCGVTSLSVADQGGKPLGQLRMAGGRYRFLACCDADKHPLQMSVTPEKAKKILKDGKVNGKPLTEKQRRYFGAVAGGNNRK